MKNTYFIAIAILVCFTACEKAIEEPIKQTPPDSTPTKPTAIMYTIFKGQQFSNKNGFATVNVTTLKFKAKFDSSAMYQTTNPENQGDINKLYGFADNNAQHHSFSARFGWRWFNNQLEIFAYVYNNGILSYKKVGNATIAQEQLYTIKITDGNYVFMMGEQTQTMPRNSTTPTGQGYKLYPYFGGDELAPQDITILIEEL